MVKKEKKKKKKKKKTVEYPVVAKQKLNNKIPL